MMTEHYKQVDNFAFFYGGCFSQWWKCVFEDDNKQKFNTAEQFMMNKKAIHFNDLETARFIMISDDAKRQKELGRKVRNFDIEEWNRVCRKYVYEGNFYKFSQNENLKNILLSTKDLYLVEASPYDLIWGIGRSLNWKTLGDVSTWRGTNWLGETITKLKINFYKYTDEEHLERI